MKNEKVTFLMIMFFLGMTANLRAAFLPVPSADKLMLLAGVWGGLIVIGTAALVLEDRASKKALKPLKRI